MAELLAESFLSAAFQKLFETLGSRVFANFFLGKKSIDDQLRKLRRKLERARLLINDAEERQITEQSVKKWLDDLKDVIFRAEDLVEDINDEARSKQEHDQSPSVTSAVMDLISPDQFTEFDETVQGELAVISEDLDDLLATAVVLGLKYVGVEPTRPSVIRVPAPLREESYVYGREADKEKILNLLLSDNVWGKKIGVVPIVGMGGLGKTTLARLVYDDMRVKEHGFGIKAWVMVSIEFDILRTTKTILQQVLGHQRSETEELAELQCKLKNALRGKKFLFVLDDVWDEDYDNWDVLKSAFASGDSGSRIIVTTRSGKVASVVKTGRIIYELQQVSSEDCWKIFVDHAFDGDSDADSCLQGIGKRIVEKCKGLPLAVKSIGGVLRNERTRERWERVLASRMWEQSSVILPSLWLSYCYLPSSLKQCFAYCSLFPKDYNFRKEILILLWMAEGFLQSNQKETKVEEVGEQIFNELVSRSLFQRSCQDGSMVSIHDLVHDLATFVSGEFCFRIENVDGDRNLKPPTCRTRHVSYAASVDHNLWPSLSQANHLRAFMTLSPYQFSTTELAEKIIPKGRFFRVLSLPILNSISMLSDSLGSLKHLRYLDLSGSWIEEIPCSICTLYNLQTLLLSYCRRLTQLPTEMGKLINLRHLNITGSPLKEMPPQMGNLKDLQRLSDFVLGESNSGSSIKELALLRNLGGELRISGLQNVDSVEDVQKAGLMDKANLTELALEWKGDTSDTRREKEVLSALRPHTNLKKLTIAGYAASSFPNWIADSLFSMMVSVHLSGNHDFCHSLPPLGQLASLQELVIKSFHGVEKIGVEFYGNNSSITPFQSLETLEFCDMQRWKVWSFTARDGKEDGCFPRLKNLYLRDCPNLTGSLPYCETIESLGILSSYDSMESLTLNNFPKLVKLELYRCKNLKKLVDFRNVIETVLVTECHKFEFLRSQHYDSISELWIASCDSLNVLPLDLFPRLESLGLENCQNLESIMFTEEAETALHSLNSLFLYSCKNLRSLPKHMNRLLPSLSFMIIDCCFEFESFPEGGLPSSLNHLWICNCSKLVDQHRHWDLEQLSSLTSLSISDCDTVLDSFPEGLLPISLNLVHLESLPNLTTLNGSAFQKVAALDVLSLAYCNEIQILPDEVLSTSLSSLIIVNCPFLQRRYSRGTGEEWHKISHIPEISIDG